MLSLPPMRTLPHPLHSDSLSWLPLLPCCAPPPCLLCSPSSLVVWLPRSVCLCCSPPCLLELLGAPFAHPVLSHPPTPPRTRLRTTLTVPLAVGWSRPCCHPHGGHLLGRGAQPPPLWSMRAPCRGRGGSLFADGSLGVHPHLVVAAVLAPHGPPVHCCMSCWGLSHCRVWGGLVPSCFVVCIPPNLVLFFLLPAQSPLPVCATGGAACRSLPPVVAVGRSHCDLGGTKGSGHFCTSSACLQTDLALVFVGVFLGECDALLLLCILGC